MTKKIDLEAILSELGPRFAARAAKLDETDSFVTENYNDLRQHKVFSALIPQAYGGGGADYVQMCEFLRGIAHHCPSTALSLSMHQHLIGTAVANDKAGRPGRPLLDKVASSEIILVSTGANDWLESNGSAQRVDGGYRVNAFKPFASGSPMGDVAVTSVAYDDPVEGPQVLHFPLPMTADGVVFMDDWKTLGMRATGSQTVKFDNVFVPDEAIVMRRPRDEYHMAFSVILTVALPLIMSAYVGVAEAAASLARNRVKGREDDTIAHFQVGEMETLLTTAQITRSDMIRHCNEYDFVPTIELASNMLQRKTICGDHVIATAEKALEVTGGAGFMRKFGLERFLRDAHGARFHPLPKKRQQLFTGRVAMDLDPVVFTAVSQQQRSAA